MSDEITFSELDKLCDLDPLQLTTHDLDRLIQGMRAYRANALGKATKFSDEAGIGADKIRAAMKKIGAIPTAPKIARRI